MLLNRKAFTLVEMLVALAVSSIVIIAAYASYDMVKTQYEKNIGIADMHTSGRAIMRIIERDIRMAGYEHRDSSGNKIFSTGITNQLVLSESSDACCDGVSVTYDHSTDATGGVERRRITYSVREFPGKEKVDYELLDSDTTRYRLYKKIDVLGKDGLILSTEEIGTEQVLADFVEDLQVSNTSGTSYLYVSHGDSSASIDIYDLSTGKLVKTIGPGGKALAYSSDGSIAALVWSWGRSIYIINPKTGRTLSTIGDKLNGGLAFGPDGFLYAPSETSGIHVYDIKTKKLVRTIDIGGASNSVLAFGKDNSLYAVHHGPGDYIKKIDIRTGETIGGFKRPIASTGSITGLAFSSSDGLLYESSYHTSGIRSYDTDEGKIYGASMGSKPYCGLAFGPNNLLYAVGKYGTVEVFNATSKKKVKDLKVTSASRNQFCGVTVESNLKVSSLVNIKLTLRSKNKRHPENITYTKEVDEEHHIGNYNFEFNDKYKRDVFFSTVAVRNMLL
jgi:prepilin-type N-terminal cleavage/methylation domain-containing protein